MRVFTATLLITAVIACNIMSGTTAYAAAYYCYAYVDEGVTAYFCSEPDSRASLFAVPETYCVTVIEEYDDNWYYVKYAEDDGVYIALYGYMLKSDVVTSEQPLENVYLHMTVKLKYSTDKVNGMTSVPDIEVTAAFYGSYLKGGAECSYLYCNGSFGYYPETYYYERNPLPAQPSFNGETKDENTGIIAAVAITAIAIVAVAVLYFSSKRKPERDLLPPPK